MKTKLNVGFVTTVSGRWPRELPYSRKEKYSKWLKNTFKNYNIVNYNLIVEDKKSLESSINYLNENKVDVIVMIYGAFSGDDYATGLAEGVGVPLIIWALQEPELEGGRLLANALVAATMNCASLKRLNLPYHFVFGDETEEKTFSELKSYLSSYDLKKKMSKAMLGMFGYRPTAFYNSTGDEGLIRRTFGVKMEETDLKVVFDKMAIYSKEQVDNEIKKINIPFASTLPKEYIDNHARLAMAMREIFAEQGYDCATLKCWPEMGSLKTTPCAVIGRLCDEGYPLICESDIDAGLTYLAETFVTNKACFVTDLINIREDINAVTVWHCGNAAPSLISPNCKPIIDDHPLAGQGTAIRCTLKTGTVTLARFCNINGEYKLFIALGEAIETEMYTPGAMLNIKLDVPVREAIYKIIEEGIPHHYVICWDNIVEELKAYAKLLNIEIIEL